MFDRVIKSRDRFQSLHNVCEVFAYLCAWADDQNENRESFEDIISMLEKKEIWEMILAIEIIRDWLNVVWVRKDLAEKSKNA